MIPSFQLSNDLEINTFPLTLLCNIKLNHTSQQIHDSSGKQKFIDCFWLKLSSEINPLPSKPNIDSQNLLTGSTNQNHRIILIILKTHCPKRKHVWIITILTECKILHSPLVTILMMLLMTLCWFQNLCSYMFANWEIYKITRMETCLWLSFSLMKEGSVLFIRFFITG